MTEPESNPHITINNAAAQQHEWDRTSLKAMFPNASTSLVSANARIIGGNHGEKICVIEKPVEPDKPIAILHRKELRLVVIGQVRGGKNNMGITQAGVHYPHPQFARWSKDAILRVKAQLPKGFTPFHNETSVDLAYYAGDRRRRDQPAILDALWHVLERSGVITDDSLLWLERSTRGYDKENPRAEIILSEKFA